MKTFRIPTAALAALVALATIILGFLQLSVTILTFDPRTIHDAVRAGVGKALTPAGIPDEAISVVSPEGGIQTAGYLNSWGGLPLVDIYLNSLPVADSNTAGAIASSEFMNVVISTYQPSGNLDISDSARARAKQVVQAYTNVALQWRDGVEYFAGLNTFDPAPAGQLLVSGAALESLVLLALGYVLVTQGHNSRTALGIIAILSMAAMALLFASAAIIKSVVLPYLEKSGLEIMPEVEFDDGLPGSQSPGTGPVGAIAYYNVDPTFMPRSWAAAALSLVVMVLCVALCAQPAPPAESRRSWMGGPSDEKYGRISPPFNPSASTDDALEARGVPTERKFAAEEAGFAHHKGPSQQASAVSSL